MMRSGHFLSASPNRSADVTPKLLAIGHAARIIPERRVGSPATATAFAIGQKYYPFPFLTHIKALQ